MFDLFFIGRLLAAIVPLAVALFWPRSYSLLLRVTVSIGVVGLVNALWLIIAYKSDVELYLLVAAISFGLGSIAHSLSAPRKDS